jgi:hypothetical protein
LNEVLGIHEKKPVAGEPPEVKAKRSKAEDQAYDSIDNLLDVVTLAKEINNLKVLARLILGERHLELLPKMALGLALSDAEKAEKPRMKQRKRYLSF